eukprot:2623497-Pleurochrysis_carterae.AAC.1
MLFCIHMRRSSKSTASLSSATTTCGASNIQGPSSSSPSDARSGHKRESRRRAELSTTPSSSPRTNRSMLPTPRRSASPRESYFL